ncbi:MAG: sulfatase-like hydrolase/transferase [Acidobacteria bacterium]|nr:sulfatase-like hydrolase/transferase [Acidobacteriota bacterium]
MRGTTRVIAIVASCFVAACSAPGPDDRPADAGVVLDLVADEGLANTVVDGALTDLARLGESELAARGFLNRDGALFGTGPATIVEFHAFRPRAREITVHFDPTGWFRRADGRLQVSINGDDVAVLRRRDMGAPITIALGADTQRIGVNEIEFRYLSGENESNFGDDSDRPRGVFLALTLGSLEPEQEPTVPTTVGSTDGLRIPVGIRREFFANVPDGAELHLDGFTTAGVADELELQVEFAQDGATPTLTTLDPTTRTSEVISFDLEPGPTRIALMVSRGGNVDADEGSVVLAQARLMGTAAPAIATAGPALADPPNVIVYLIDTLRADHLGVYGYDRPTSPNLDRFATDAVVFEALQAQSSWTKPAIASTMTGLLPQQHGVQGRQDYLGMDSWTLATVLQMAGYATYAATTNSTVFSDFNFDQGFHEFVELGEQPTAEVHQLADAVNEQFFTWLDRRPKQAPFFAYLHTTDPHAPYAPREPYRSMFASELIADVDINKPANAHRALQPGTSLDAEDVRRHMVGLYDAEIAFNDAQFGLLVERLKAEDLYDSSLIIVLSDHGEEFLDHGAWSHGATLFQEQLHVPLIVKLPNGARAGERVAERAQHVDIFPTVMESAGLDFATAGPGVSLLSLGNELGNRPALSHLALTTTLHESVAVGADKLMRSLAPDGRLQARLFDLVADPGESAATTRVVTHGYLLDLLARAALLGIGAESEGQVILDPEMTEQLRALGYIQ